MSSAERSRPNALQYVAYCSGSKLPASMHDWVQHDLAGKGAAGRMVFRVTIPTVMMLAPMWLIPTSLYVHASMTMPILIPFVYFAIALNKVYRRHRLSQHNLDPELVEELTRKRDAHLHESYAERYGPRQ